jgi:hypothetical protein
VRETIGLERNRDLLTLEIPNPAMESFLELVIKTNLVPIPGVGADFRSPETKRRFQDPGFGLI